MDNHGGLVIGLLEIGVIYVDGKAELNDRTRVSVTKTGALQEIGRSQGRTVIFCPSESHIWLVKVAYSARDGPTLSSYFSDLCSSWGGFQVLGMPIL